MKLGGGKLSELKFWQEFWKAIVPKENRKILILFTMFVNYNTTGLPIKFVYLFLRQKISSNDIKIFVVNLW